MIREAIGTAPTLDEARSKAIAQLNAPLDADVVVEVLEQATKKTLGLFGGSLAKVRAYYETAQQLNEEPEQTASQENPKSNEKTKENQKSRKPFKAEKSEEKKEAFKRTAPAEEVVSSENAPAKYLTSILSCMGITGISIITRQTDEDIFIEIVSQEDYGSIIGRRGETLDALQYLVRLSVSRNENEGRRISLNIGDYRDKREVTLKGIAKRQAEKVLKYGRNAVLDPMNPYERRIIHTTVQDIEGVSSHSIGEGEGRRVVISPSGGRSGGYRNNDRGGNNGRRREGKPQYKPQSRETREPKTDVTGEFSYGKIEPKTK